MPSDRAVCEACDLPATCRDEEGTPLCEAHMMALFAECEAVDAEKAYGDGFADACNDVIPDLVQAVGAFLSTGKDGDLAALRAAYERATPQ